jgi:TolB-like protein/DNA-binding winged helix-turn-helix (wHTH) protein/Tfp pilus assembly protein PilF
MTEKTKRFFDFGRFRLDSVERVLLADSHPVALTPKAFETLLDLLEHSGHILEKDELLKRVWPDTFVEEGTLVQNISTLRKVLGEAPDGSAYIETIPRRGYRFAGAVCKTDFEPGSKENVPPVPIVTARRAGRLGWIAGLAIAAVSLVTFFLVRERIWSRTIAAPKKIMLAVLPFENLSGDSQQEYFSTGLTEEMITQLGDLEPNRLGVIARTSALQYKGAKKDTRQIGRELGVDYILEGSVRREGDRVRITAQLIQVKDQTHLWARDYDRNLRDILALQSDVASAIAQEIKLKLTSEERARLASTPALNPEAYELYLKGRYFWNKRTKDGFVKAIGYFQQAIVRDPKYAQAYAGLADAYALLGSLPTVEIPRQEAMPKAKAAALKALELNDSLAEAHTSLAFVEMQYEWDWPGSEKEFKRALELNPNYATAHQWYAVWLMSQGKQDAALEEERRAQEADPLSTIIKTDTAQLLVYAGRYDEAVQQAQRALEIDPGFLLGHDYLAVAYTEKKDYQAAISEFQWVLAISKEDAWATSGIARTYALADQKRESEAVLRGILHAAKNREDLALQLATVYTALGENDRALAWLEKAYQRRDGGLILLNVVPEFQSLHLDPRFDDLLRRLGLPRNGEKGRPSSQETPSILDRRLESDWAIVWASEFQSYDADEHPCLKRNRANQPRFARE